MLHNQITAGKSVGIHWLSRVQEPAARVVLNGRPVAYIVREMGEELKVTWTGHSSIVIEAIKTGLISHNGWAGKSALYGITSYGLEVLTSWKTERNRLLAKIADLELRLEGVNEAVDITATSIDRIEGLTQSQTNVIRVLEKVKGVVKEEDLISCLAGKSKNPTNNLKVTLYHIKKRRPDINIVNHWGVGYELKSPVNTTTTGDQTND